MTMHERIKQILQEKFQDLRSLEVINESAKHHGHAGDDGSGQTHFKVIMTAGEFDGLSRVERQRLVHAYLAPCFAEGLHALSLALQTPGEMLLQR
jgi:BolA protein